MITTTLIVTSLNLLAQDSSNGTILAFDRKANTLVLSDRTVWPLELLKTPLAAELKAGDQVMILYESDEDGISSIQSVQLVTAERLQAERTQDGAADVVTGTVLAFDRKSRVLVFTDRSIWALSDMESALPDGLQAGDRAEILYESDEDGVSAIKSVRILSN